MLCFAQVGATCATALSHLSLFVGCWCVTAGCHLKCLPLPPPTFSKTEVSSTTWESTQQSFFFILQHWEKIPWSSCLEKWNNTNSCVRKPPKILCTLTAWPSLKGKLNREPYACTVSWKHSTERQMHLPVGIPCMWKGWLWGSNELKRYLFKLKGPTPDPSTLVTMKSNTDLVVVNLKVSPECQYVFNHSWHTSDFTNNLECYNRKLAHVGKFLIKFSSLSAPTKIEELTAGSDKKTASFRWSLRVVDSGNLGHLVVEKELTAWWKSKFHTQFWLWLHSSVLERATRIHKILGSIPGGAALCFFVWSGCQFFYLCRSWKRREFDLNFECFICCNS